MTRAQTFASTSAGTICELKKTSCPEYREIPGACSEAPYFIGDRAHPQRPVQERCVTTCDLFGAMSVSDNSVYPRGPLHSRLPRDVSRHSK